jgi:hypothetical protein
MNFETAQFFLLNPPIEFIYGGSVVVLILLYFASMKVLFGAYTIRGAVHNFKEGNKIRERYDELFSARENLMYHISWAKSRGDMDDVRTMMRDIAGVDKVGIIYYLLYRRIRLAY